MKYSILHFAFKVLTNGNDCLVFAVLWASTVQMILSRTRGSSEGTKCEIRTQNKAQLEEFFSVFKFKNLTNFNRVVLDGLFSLCGLSDGTF